jgi:catechol 2,3-dioxygenase-like lactoylglutathione lyase family enzyme
MINVKRINSVSVAVRNLERRLAWYREKLGFEKLYDDAPNSPGVIIGKDGVELDRVEDTFPEDADIAVLDDHPQYRSRIVEDPDGHAIEFYAVQ